MILEIFKKKKTPKPQKPKEEIKPRTEKKKVKAEAYRVLKSPHVTEKATDLTKKNQYVFKVTSGTNKTEIKKAIENLYGVDVLSVKIINVREKQRRVGRNLGWRKAYKKAIVKLKEGQKIEILPT